MVQNRKNGKKKPSNHSLSHEIGSERTNEHNKAREQSEQCGASECVVLGANIRAIGPVLMSGFLIILAYSAFEGSGYGC